MISFIIAEYMCNIKLHVITSDIADLSAIKFNKNLFIKCEFLMNRLRLVTLAFPIPGKSESTVKSQYNAEILLIIFITGDP